MEIYAPCRKCYECGEEVNDDEILYEICQGYFVCEECFKAYVFDNYAPSSLADQLNINFTKAGELHESDN